MKHVCWISLFVPLMASAESKLSLDEYLKLVRSQNLSLKVEASKQDAAEAKAVGVALPPPMAGVTQMKERNGESASGFEVSQTIPFPSRLLSNHSARQLEAQAQKENSKAGEQEILTEARLLYFSAWAAQEKLSILREKKDVIDTHIKLSQAAARSDSFLKVHVLKAESERDALENEILSEEQIVKQKQAELAESIDVNPAVFQPVVMEPPLSPLPNPSPTEQSHQFEAARLSLEGQRARESEAKASWFPELNLRYKKMGETTMTPEYSEVMIGVTLPFVYFWAPKASSRSATADRLQAELTFAKERRRIETMTTIARTKAEALKKQLENLSKKLLPRAEQRMKLVHNIAPRDMETIQDHRETMESFPDLKLKALELRTEYEEAVASLEKYTNPKDSQ